MRRHGPRHEAQTPLRADEETDGGSEARGEGAPGWQAGEDLLLAGLESPERSAPPLAEVDAEVLEFIEALDRFKKQNGRPFPSWSEVLLVVRQLGYVRK